MQTILVIDDHPDITRVVTQVLEDAGFHVFTAADGTAGLACARDRHPDLVIVDLGLPDIEGEQLIRALRTTSQMPLLVLTASDEVDRKVRAFAAGADDYLTKPFHAEELVARVQALLRPRHAVQVTSVGPLSVWSAERRCYYDGSEVGLSEKEFDLVHLLATQPGRVYTRTEISQRLLDGGSSGSNLVDVHISNLRGKLREHGGFGLIRTVRGIGYALKVPRQAHSSGSQSHE